VLAAAGTLAFVVATKDPGVAVGVTAGSAVLAASAAAWPSSARGKKSSDDPHEVTKKSSSASPPTAPLAPLPLDSVRLSYGVRCTPLGPSPCCQARWVEGAAAPDNARCSGPVPVTFRPMIGCLEGRFTQGAKLPLS
jgi:hypothetical protein